SPRTPARQFPYRYARPGDGRAWPAYVVLPSAGRRGGCYTSLKIAMARVSHIGIATRADRDGNEALGSRLSNEEESNGVSNARKNTRSDRARSFARLRWRRQRGAKHHRDRASHLDRESRDGGQQRGRRL